ncbi:hypothetical protein PCANC_14255 [Puccinia coronata f. sp. avenae]|uniref:Uncharacterized protein n=1 Tax=Puccinia coronata f. sp. avenae TaxID=200324 RepID=A0A2N5SRL7_9BASI|nr:hypothetical protein PCANC_14255 [Puccinia coronata f. sp. avenae]PLW22869.1 hypothetical protein PCASD_16216 [Puccinia coronata f. sp. avenae]
MIPHGGLFSAKNKATLESPKDFFNFVEACQALDTAEVDNYLRFAKVNPCNPDVSKVINDMGITHYSAFAKFKEINFEKRGIKPAPSRLMTSCVGKYKRHLKRAKENSQLTLH